MSDSEAATASVEQMPTPARSMIISDELNRIMGAVRSVCPEDADLSFGFDGKLQMHIDVRKLEDVARVETLLPTLCGGIFSNLQRGLVDNRPFFHRVTALVER
jgi:hypothetical protein